MEKLHNESKNDAIQKMRRAGIGLDHEGEYWTKEHKRLLRRFYAQGDDIAEMALFFGRSERAVVQQLTQEGCFLSKHRQSRKPKPEKICENCPDCPYYQLFHQTQEEN